MLDTYRPALLVVENEENSELFYAGTPEQYCAQFKAACQAAHRKASPCTKGGLVSPLAALLVYDPYLQSVQPARAEDLASRAFSPEQRRLLRSDRARERMARGKVPMQAYRAQRGSTCGTSWPVGSFNPVSVAGAPATTCEESENSWQWVGDFGDSLAIGRKASLGPEELAMVHKRRKGHAKAADTVGNGAGEAPKRVQTGQKRG